ncbi:helix-turn-helix transcriptional regulator [Paraburkholderia rhizosphaerae]|uniref:helix-turn-helix transcriptional regulator n=1 Tax=Paraburkholderia rhizosphaerae TaxID=480658 RepID=UPI0035ECABAD
MGASQAHLHRLFRADGHSLMRYVLCHRLEMAAELLTRPGGRRMHIKELAFRCGFVNAAHFSRAFRRRFAEGDGDHEPACDTQRRRRRRALNTSSRPFYSRYSRSSGMPRVPRVSDALPPPGAAAICARDALPCSACDGGLQSSPASQSATLTA